ncbi:MAG: transporter substrate-binding domain-containing protein [Desulfobulbaceae bacterium]|nr:transporter substrate-binding domain-containing protein [Desulfobulbaceae bacterium]
MKSILMIFFMTLIFSSSAFAQSKIIFNSADSPTLRRSVAMKELLTELFQRMGMEFSVVYLPSARALKNANDGIEDGNFLRTGGIKAYPNLIQVLEKISEIEVVAFSKNKNIHIKDWSSLEPYNVTYVTGWKLCDAHLFRKKSLVTVRNEDLLFTLLEKDRADIGIFGRKAGYETMKRLGITDIEALSDPLYVDDLYFYINKKHAKLIPAIIETLREMKRDGTYESIVRKAFESIGSGEEHGRTN